MKRETILINEELNILIYSIMNDDFLKDIHPIMNSKLLKTSYSKLVWTWIDEHFNEFGKAPGRYIEEIYKQKRGMLQEEDAETNDSIALFLKNLSEKWSEYETITDIDPIIKSARTYLRRRELEYKIEQAQAALDSNDLDESEKVLEEPSSITAKKSDEVEITGKELLNKEIAKPIPLIPNFLMLGSCIMLVGSSKIGKSWMALQLAKSIVTGGTFFSSKDYIPNKKREVLYLANEDTLPIIQDRLKKLKVNPEKVDGLHLFFNWKTRGIEAVKRVKEYVKNNKKVKLIIIDCLGTIRGKANNRNIYDDDYVEIQRWRDLCHELKITIIIIHHPRKTIAYGNVSDYDIMEMTSGSNAIGGCADRTMILTRKRNDVKAKLYSMGRDCIDSALALIWEPVESGNGWVLNGNGNIEDAEDTEERRQVMQYLGYEIKTTGEIAYALNRKKPATSLLLEKLEDQGRIEKVGYGKWKRK